MKLNGNFQFVGKVKRVDVGEYGLSSHLIIVFKCCLQVIKIVIVCLLQVMSHSSHHSSFSVTTSQEFAGNSHVNQVPCAILIWFDHHAKCVITRNSESVFDWIMYLPQLWLGSFSEVVHSFGDNFCCFFPKGLFKITLMCQIIVSWGR